MSNDNTNELSVEYLSVIGLNPWAGHDSSSRQQMFSSHIAQRLVVKGATERRIQTGLEKEFGKYTFSVKMPVDGKIVKVIDRYPRSVSGDGVSAVVETLVIYEDEKTKELGCFTIPYYTSYHQYFGFNYKITPAVSRLIPGSYVEKDTIFADSPTITENGGYKYGIEMNMAFMSHPAVSEDGVLISSDALDRLKFKIYETRVVDFGSSHFPLNIYGTEQDYKPFPEIGDYVRDDGLLTVLRSYEQTLGPVETSIYDTMEPDFIFDKPVYVRSGVGKVVDMRVYHDDDDGSPTPIGIEKHLNKYVKGLKDYYQEILNVEKSIRAERRKKFGINKVDLKPELHRLIVEAMCHLDQGGQKASQKLNKLYRQTPLDDYRVEFVIEYEIMPDIGFKLTDGHGGKGVICQIEKPENMPVDEHGNRADIVMDSGSTINRMNLGRLYEHYIGAACRDTAKNIVTMLGIQSTKENEIKNQLNSLPKDLVEKAFQYLLGFYQITSPKQHEFFSTRLSDAEKNEHLGGIIKNGIYLYMPPDNAPESIDIIKQLEEHYRPVLGPVRYIGNSGEVKVTKYPVRIAPLYMMLLEKIADDWASVSSGKLQHFGVLSPMTKSEKYSYPYRNSPVRTIGETEGRIFTSYCGREAMAEMMDRNNNTITHKNVVWNILAAPQPGNIGMVVDRSVVPFGGSKPLQLVNHISTCGGWTMAYEPEE